MTSFAQVCAELDRRSHVTLGFERIEALLAAMGHPERAIPNLVQVVGTNGKGTTAARPRSALEELGHPSGAYLSPHVLSYTERVVLRGSQVIRRGVRRRHGRDDRARGQSRHPRLAVRNSYRRRPQDVRSGGLSWAVLEAGLGARHDATSVARPDAVVLTNVAIDHTEYLGETVEEIAEEKLASLRPGATLFLGTEDGRVVELARSACRRLGASGSARRSRRERIFFGSRPVRGARRAPGARGRRVSAGNESPRRGREKVARAVARGASWTVRGARGRGRPRGA